MSETDLPDSGANDFWDVRLPEAAFGAAAVFPTRFGTIHKFKGLEADCVLLTGMGAPSSFFTSEHMQRFRYVGGSRARVILSVFEW